MTKGQTWDYIAREQETCLRCDSYTVSDERFAQQEAGDNLTLDLGQVILMDGFLASLHAVLGVGQNEGHDVPLQLVSDHMQVRQIGRAHFVAGGWINRGAS